jgi:hypothetical protein
MWPSCTPYINIRTIKKKKQRLRIIFLVKATLEALQRNKEEKYETWV